MEAGLRDRGRGLGGLCLPTGCRRPAPRCWCLEHGGTDWGPLIQMPGALSYPMNMARYDWGYRSEPEPNLGGRRLPVRAAR